MSVSAVSTPANSDLLTPLINQSKAATDAAKQQMANNVSNGLNASGQSSTGSVAGNFNTFLSILTTQLQNQDPTSPMDTSQFTQELVQFSGVEQQLNTNSLLQQLVNASGGSGVRSLLGYVNQYVEVPANDQLLIQGKQANFSYTLPSTAKSVAIQVQDSSGKTVAALQGPTSNGVNNIAWNGQDSNGNQLSDGVYKLVIKATDGAGNTLTPTNVSLIGQVTGVQTADGNGNDLLMGPSMLVNDKNVQAVFSSSTIPNASQPSS